MVGASGAGAPGHLLVRHAFRVFACFDVLALRVIGLASAELVAELDEAAADDGLVGSVRSLEDADEDRIPAEVELFPGHGRRILTSPIRARRKA